MNGNRERRTSRFRQVGPGWKGCRRVLVAFVLISIVLAAGSPGVEAQATPVPAVSNVPAPDECQIPMPEFISFPPETMDPIAATPVPIVTEPPEPFSPPDGEPADAETVAAVSATVREAVACRNAGDTVRTLALFTPNMLADLYGSPATLDPEVLRGIQEGPRPLPEPRRLGIDAIADVVDLPDGRAGALVETSTSRRAFRDYLYFVLDPERGRWLIDGSVPLP